MLNRQPMGICYVAQEAQPGTPHQPGGVEWGGG